MQPYCPCCLSRATSFSTTSWSTRADARAFLHNSTEHLEALLVAEASRCRDGATVFVAVESVYSMDGDLCPLVEVVRASKRHGPKANLCIIVDEAHGAGVYGPQGRGCTAALGLEQDVSIRLVTFGKALGSAGAAVLCSDMVKQFLINYARPLVSDVLGANI
jgi:8-amino-7-oxononanoate synthase